MSDSINIEGDKLELKSKFVARAIMILAGGLGLFHLYTASFGILPAYFQSSVHWALIAAFIVFTKPLKGTIGKVIDIILILLTWYVSYYLIAIQEELAVRAGSYTNLEICLSILALIVSIEIGRRVVGLILPIICGIFILYALFGSHVPGILNTASFPIARVAPYLYTGSDGLFGQTIYVSAQFIYLFVLFGTVLDLTGAGEFFVNIAYSIAGRIAGGPAQAAVFSSTLLGMINGSGAANVVTTGTFTIPLMKKVGYRPAVAGAVEAVASSGGQIMPPVMGAAAFLMAEITGIPYVNIAVAAIVPAVLYYLTLSSSVYIIARKSNFKGMSPKELPNFWATLKKGWLYLAPLVILILVLARGLSPQRAAFYAIVVSFAVGFIKDRDKMTFVNIINAFKNAISNIAPIAAACLLAGIIMGTINLTGLGIKISGIIGTIANGNLIIALLLTMLTSLILGMGLPTSAAYLILAVLVGPALEAMGVSTIGSHLFLLYFGALSTITPPVALSTFAAAGIAGSGVWETGKEAVKLAAAGFIIPFMFAYNGQLLLIGNISEVVLAIVSALIGCIVLSISLTGWFKKDLSIVARILLFVISLTLIAPLPLYITLFAVAVVMVILFVDLKLTSKSAM